MCMFLMLNSVLAHTMPGMTMSSSNDHVLITGNVKRQGRHRSRAAAEQKKTVLRDPESVNTALVTACGLIGGFATAQQTGIRPLGGVVLAAAGLYAGRSWVKVAGPGVAGALGAVYMGAFGLSHPLAKKIGAWPSVFAVTAVAAGAACALSDSRAERCCVKHHRS